MKLTEPKLRKMVRSVLKEADYDESAIDEDVERSAKEHVEKAVNDLKRLSEKHYGTDDDDRAYLYSGAAQELQKAMKKLFDELKFYREVGI